MFIDSFIPSEKCDGKKEREYDSIYGPPTHRRSIDLFRLFNDRRQWRKILYGNQIETGILIYYFGAGLVGMCDCVGARMSIVMRTMTEGFCFRTI